MTSNLTIYNSLNFYFCDIAISVYFDQCQQSISTLNVLKLINIKIQSSAIRPEIFAKICHEKKKAWLVSTR